MLTSYDMKAEGSHHFPSAFLFFSNLPFGEHLSDQAITIELK